MEVLIPLHVVNTTVTTTVEDGECAIGVAARHPPAIKKKKRILRPRMNHAFTHIRAQHPIVKNIHYLVYPTGKIVILGCKSLEEIDDAITWLANQTHTTKPMKYILHNIVGSVKFDKAINLSDLFIKIQAGRGPDQYIGYHEPEMSPALVYAPICNKKARCLVFRSGSAIITGIKWIHDLDVVFQELKSVLNAP